MQADNYIQSPEEYDSYNRYAYCRYNPFKYTDPSGEMYSSNYITSGTGELIDDNLGRSVNSESATHEELEAYAAYAQMMYDKVHYKATHSGSGGGGGGSTPATAPPTKPTGDTGTGGVSGENGTNGDETAKVQGCDEAPQPARDTELDENGRNIIGDKTPIIDENGYLIKNNKNAYNCFSWAWHCGEGDPSQEINQGFPTYLFPKWDNDPMDDADEMANPLKSDQTVQVGDRIIYFDYNGTPLHSAIVSEVNEQGLATRCTSKFGDSYLFEHHPRDVWPSYGSYRKYYRMKEEYR